MSEAVLVRRLGLQPYADVWAKMREFTSQRGADTQDELWLVQHPPVFTQGQAGKAEHILDHGEIPVIKTDRGGQVTFHGPGQLVAYPLFDLKRLGLGPRAFVTAIEDSVIDFLASWGVTSQAKPEAPGVYVEGRKIASLGLRVRRGCSFHGVSININMDLQPFNRINPCGYAGMKMTQLADLVNLDGLSHVELEQRYAQGLLSILGAQAVHAEA